MDDLPPSDQFERYLHSPIHGRRVLAAKARALQRMQNFASSEVYPAISEALGTIAALAEFYTAPIQERRSLTEIIAGDPVRPRSALEAAAPTEVETVRPKLTKSERKLLAIMSDGAARTREQLSEATGSRAQSQSTVNAKISGLRRKLVGTPIIIATGPGPTYSIVATACDAAKKLAGIA